jgi:thioesterase domain-containing protein
MKSLEEKTGQRLPITSLFEAPTVEKLSFLLNRDKHAISWKSLVPIKADGTRPPLYIIHGSGLTVMVFNSLARGMDPDQPVYGLQARGLNGVDEPFDRMEDIAGYYISEILEQNPDGPFCLAGYSFGGFVAFEMARQLKAMGKEIKMLAIFDTYADNSDNFVPFGPRMVRKLKRQFPKFRFIMGSMAKQPYQTLKYQSKFFLNKLIDILAALGLHEKRPWEGDMLEHSTKINQKHDIASSNYRMTAYDGVIDLFRVKTRLNYLDDRVYLGWKPFAKDVKIHEIPGDHRTFLMPPNDRELAKILRAILDERFAAKETRAEFAHKSVLRAI